MTTLNKGNPRELEERTIKNYTPFFIEEYKKCKQDLNCKRFSIDVIRDIDAGPVERIFVKCAKENNLTLMLYYNNYGNKDIYEFSFA